MMPNPMIPRRLAASIAASVTALAVVGASATALAAVPNDSLVCAPEVSAIASTSWMRAVSLDVRGDVPSVDEYRAVRDGEATVETLVDEWLASDGFSERVLRQHRKLLWNNITNVRVLPASSGISRTNLGGGVYTPYYRRSVATRYRGLAVPCLDEPAEYNDGVLVRKLQSDGTLREGWVYASPYWDPSLTWKVCALDAQEALYTSKGTDCSSSQGVLDNECGCGPEMRWCSAGSVQRQIVDGFRDSMDKLISSVITDDRPYTDLFTANEMWVNGPMAHFLRYQTAWSGPARVYPSPVSAGVIPPEEVLPFTASDTWIKLPVASDHAGILTHPAFLLRFQTRRARANVVYNAFLCTPFQPPEGGLPPATDAEALNPDLQKRAGCKYCHALLEPAGAFWGRWAERGAGFLNPEEFPAVREDCYSCATSNIGCSSECRSFYQTTALSVAEVPFLGQLQAFVFLDESHVEHVDAGPSLIAMRAVADNRLPMCVAERTSEWLMGRTMTPEDAGTMQELAAEFVASGFSYKEMVKAIVTSDIYRRVR